VESCRNHSYPIVRLPCWYHLNDASKRGTCKMSHRAVLNGAKRLASEFPRRIPGRMLRGVDIGPGLFELLRYVARHAFLPESELLYSASPPVQFSLALRSGNMRFVYH
jgi:hypothetical protein